MAGAKVNYEAIRMKTYEVAKRKVEPLLEYLLSEGAEKFADILEEEMGSSVPESVRAHARSLSVDYGSLNDGVGFWVNQHGRGWFQRGEIEVVLRFDDDLGRPAFGNDAWLDNILVIFDKGYTITGPKLPAGDWHGERWVARRSRDGLDFMMSACRRARREIKGVRNAVAE